MDPGRFLTGRFLIGRFLILALTGLMLSSCGTLRGLVGPPRLAAEAPAIAVPAALAPAPIMAPIADREPAIVTMAPIPNPPERTRASRASLTVSRPAIQTAPTASPSRPEPAVTGPTAIALANRQARETSRADAFVGGVQVFSYDPGRVYEVWTAPLRVTTLTLAPGETVVSKAAGDTVRWQIGETTSGQGPGQRSHVMIKPLEKGLETNLVLATSQRIYLVQLKSGAAEGFNAAVTWDLGALAPPMGALLAEAATAPDPLVTPAGPLDARYRIEPRGRRPAWTPTTVMTDGVRTFLAFPPELASREAPALFVVGPGGETQLVNYRQQDGLWVVDRVFDQAELRVGDKRRETVRIRRGGRS